MEFIDPRGTIGGARPPYELRLRQGPATVALLSNGYPDATRFLELIADELTGVSRDLSFKLFEKPSNVGRSPETLVEEVVGCADAVINAYGHCGSCTSGTVRDAVVFASRGIPSVALVTEKFWEEGAFIARGAGMEDVPRVHLPYPVAGSDEPTLHAIAAAAAPAVLSALHGEG